MMNKIQNIIIIVKFYLHILYIVYFKHNTSFSTTFIFCTSFFILVNFIQIAMDKSLAMYNNYTYCKRHPQKSGTRYQCSSYVSKKCPAYLIINDNGTLVRGSEIHTHEPPNYYRKSDGIYIKMS